MDFYPAPNKPVLYKTTTAAFKQVYCFTNREKIAWTERREKGRGKRSRITLPATWEAIIMRVGLLKKEDEE